MAVVQLSISVIDFSLGTGSKEHTGQAPPSEILNAIFFPDSKYLKYMNSPLPQFFYFDFSDTQLQKYAHTLPLFARSVVIYLQLGSVMFDLPLLLGTGPG